MDVRFFLYWLLLSTGGVLMDLGFFGKDTQRELPAILVGIGFAFIVSVVINAIATSEYDEDVAFIFWGSLILALITCAAVFLMLNGAGATVLPDGLVTTCVATLIMVAVLVVLAAVLTIAGVGRRSSR